MPGRFLGRCLHLNDRFYNEKSFETNLLFTIISSFFQLVDQRQDYTGARWLTRWERLGAQLGKCWFLTNCPFHFTFLIGKWICSICDFFTFRVCNVWIFCQLFNFAGGVESCCRHCLSSCGRCPACQVSGKWSEWCHDQWPSPSPSPW